MNAASLPWLSTSDLIALASAARPGPCPACAALVDAAWASVPATFDAGTLHRVGTLQREGDEDPTLTEHHPGGTHGWSAHAPIAPAFFPYNRCTVWCCKACARPFLRYTEYGGYYEDERIRPVLAGLVDDTPV